MDDKKIFFDDDETQNDNAAQAAKQIYNNIVQRRFEKYKKNTIKSNIRRTISIFRYPGNKSLLLPHILPLLPTPQKITKFVEPFCGTATVTVNKPYKYDREIINDIDDNIANFFEIIANEQTATELIKRFLLTPYSQYTYNKMLRHIRNEGKIEDPIERAYAFVIFVRLTYGGLTGRYNFGNFNETSNSLISTDDLTALVEFYIEQLRDVVVTRMDGIKCILRHDSPTTLFFIDPPYIDITTDLRSFYNNNDATQYSYHKELLQTLNNIEGYFILTTYPNELYTEYLRNVPYKDVQIISGLTQKKKKENNGVNRLRTERIYYKLPDDNQLAIF